MTTSPLKPRRKTTRKIITQRIVDTGSQLILTSPEEMLESAKCGTMAPDIMERFLRTVKGTLDPDVATSSLLSILLMRAIEKVEYICVDNDEDHHWISENRYDIRYENYIYLLKRMVEESPLEIARDSRYAIVGQGIIRSTLGSKYPIIVGGWEQIRDAVSRFNAVPLD